MVLTKTIIIYYNPLQFLLQYDGSLNCSYSRTVIDDNATLDFFKIISSITTQFQLLVQWGGDSGTY